jgi:hypothetical protein
VACGGKGCSKCDGGVWNYDGCPHELIDDATIEALRYARLARDGTWPVMGGALDQTEWATQAFTMIWNEQDIAEAEIMKRV